jgi:hypothetical protein
LSDFACKALTRNETALEDQEILLSTQQLCRFLAIAEEKIKGRKELIRDSLIGVKKRKRSDTPLERITSDDEAWYTNQEKRAAKHMAEDDPDYEDAVTETH